MADDWFVPGIGLVASDEHTVRLRPPEHWRRDVIEIPRRPPSMNSNVGRGHWTAFYNAKKDWQGEIEFALMQLRPPRDNQRALAGAFIRFDRRLARPPDRNNYATLVDKALGDALVNYGVIPDDNDAYYLFGGVEFEEETGPPRTRVFLYTQPRES